MSSFGETHVKGNEQQWFVAFCMNCIKERARHIPSQTDPTVGLFRNMLCSFGYVLFWQ